LALDKLKDDQERGARRALIEQLFEDHYEHRRRVYKINFIRGLFFGLGSVIGGTVVIAIVIWLLTLFVDFPLIGDYFETLQQTLENEQ
jgi:hypothetical protein